MTKILIVEDEYDIASTMELALEMEGFEVRHCTNGREGLKALSDEALPGLIISDIMMPVMDGYAFIHALRAIPRYNNIPVILSSAGRLDESRLLKKGHQGFISKPFDLDAFLHIVTKNVKKS